MKRYKKSVIFLVLLIVFFYSFGACHVAMLLHHYALNQTLNQILKFISLEQDQSIIWTNAGT